jgi:hypothetical protein
MTTANFQELANFIWSVAALLRGPYRPPQYERAGQELGEYVTDWHLASPRHP